VLGKSTDRISFVKVDVRDLSGLGEIAERFSVTGIIHAAAMTGEAQACAKPREVFDVNVGGTANVLELARAGRMRRVVYIGSSAEYGQRSDLKPIGEDELNVDGYYAETKHLGHRLGQRYHQVFGTDVLTVRVSSVYGPNTRFNAFRGLVGNTLVAHLSRAAAFGESATLGGGNEYTRGWTYAADCARGVCLAYFAREARRAVYNVASGRVYTAAEVVEAIKQVAPGADIRLDPERRAESGLQARTVRGPLDIRRAREDLGFVPRYELAQGIGEYVAWWRRLGKTSAASFTQPEPA
jgi:nucleoside-diphosphate-sugar epimerase